MKKTVQKIKDKIIKSKDKDLDFTVCPNCDHPETGNFCPNCGQANKDFNRPMKEILSDLLDSVNLDIRLVRTFIPFFFKPGFLATEYFKGRRKSYVPPLRMYVIISVLFFFFMQRETIHLVQDSTNNFNLVGKDSTALININIDEDEEEIKRDSIAIVTEDILNELKNDTSIVKDKNKFDEKIGYINSKKEMFVGQFFKYSSWSIFLLMPIFAFILKILFFRKKAYYVQHLIFSINIHSFVFALLIIKYLLSHYVFPETIGDYLDNLIFLIPIYIYAGMKNYYKSGYVGTFFRLIALGFVYMLVVLGSFISTLGLTAADLDLL